MPRFSKSICPCPCSRCQQHRDREVQLRAVTHRGPRSPHDLSGTLIQVKLVLDFATEKTFRVSWCEAELGSLHTFVCEYNVKKGRRLGRRQAHPECGWWGCSRAWVGRERTARGGKCPRDKCAEKVGGSGVFSPERPPILLDVSLPPKAFVSFTLPTAQSSVLLVVWFVFPTVNSLSS